MAVQSRERTQRTGQHSHKDIYYYGTYAGMHVYNWVRQTRIHLCKAKKSNAINKMDDKKNYNRWSIYYVQLLKQVYLRTRHHISHTKTPKRKRRKENVTVW